MPFPSWVCHVDGVILAVNRRAIVLVHIREYIFYKLNFLPQSIIASLSADTTPHLLKLKTTQQGDAEPKIVGGVNLDTTVLLGS